MNQEQRNRLGKIIAFTAAYYSRELQREVVSMMVDDLADLSFDAVEAAYQAYRRDPKNRAFPLPAQIRDIVDPEPTPEVEARDIASAIQGAIVKYGYSNEGLARQYIGPEGWDVVQRWGGWSHLCTNMGVSIDPGQFYAQVRDFATDAARFPGLRREFPTALPEPQTPKMHLLSGEKMPDGEPVPEFEARRSDRIRELMADMNAKLKERVR